jgi:hypothetical protein
LIDRPSPEDMMGFHDRQRRYFVEMASSYEQNDTSPDCFQVISAASFRDRYFWTSNGAITVVAMGDWAKALAPPTVFEFIQTLVLQGALLALCPELDTHLGTSGCIMDFAWHLADARQKVLSGFICHRCRTIIEDSGYPDLVTSLHPILSRSWLGRFDDPASPAGIVSKFGYNLFITKGFKPNKVEIIRAALLEEGVRQISIIIGTMVAAFLLAIAGYAVVNVVLSPSVTHPLQTHSPNRRP